MKILIGVSGLASKVSGVNSLLVDLAEGLRNRGHELTIVGQGDKNESMAQRLKAAHCQLISLAIQGIEGRSLRRLASILREHRPDVVATHDRNADVKFGILCRFMHIPHIPTVHGFATNFALNPSYAKRANWLRNYIWKIALRSTADIVAISETVRRDLVRFVRLPKLPSVIHNGIDINRFVPFGCAEENRKDILFPFKNLFTIVFVGRLHEEKHPHLLIDLVARLKDKGFGCQGVFVGSGPQETVLQEHCRNKKMADRIFFAGVRDDLPFIYNCSEIVVNFCAKEGFGLTIAEAMSCGCSVLAFDGGAAAEILEDRKSGFLVPLGDMEGLEQRAFELLTDRGLRDAIGHQARERVIQLFSKDRCVREYEAIYRRALNSD